MMAARALSFAVQRECEEVFESERKLSRRLNRGLAPALTENFNKFNKVAGHPEADSAGIAGHWRRFGEGLSRPQLPGGCHRPLDQAGTTTTS
jgi:hypothetical protein